MKQFMTITLVVGYDPLTDSQPDEWDWPSLIDATPSDVAILEAWATEPDELEKAGMEVAE